MVSNLHPESRLQYGSVASDLECTDLVAGMRNYMHDAVTSQNWINTTVSSIQPKSPELCRSPTVD